MIKNLTDLTKEKFIIINLAKEIGISKTAELFNYSRPTIYNWIKRYKENSFEGLQNKSRVNQNFPNKMPDIVVNSILELKAKHPEFSANKIKNTLKLKYTEKTINKKLKQSNQVQNNNQYNLNITKNSYNIFKDFFVSIKKIQYHEEPENNKLPKYIIMVEEKSTGVTFCSFSHERISLSIAIFLEYFIGFLNQINFSNKYNFYLSGSIKLSSEDLIIHIVENKYGNNLIPNYLISDFFSSRKNKPYKVLYEDLYSKTNFVSYNSLLAHTHAHLILYNCKRIKNILKSNNFLSNSIINKIRILFFDNIPIISDDHISNLSSIKKQPDYFINLYSNDLINNYKHKIKQIDSAISFLAKKGLKNESKYLHQRAEDIYLSTASFALYYILDISTFLSKNHKMNKNFYDFFKSKINNIVINLITCLSGLSKIYKSKGILRKEVFFIKRAIYFAEQYNFSDLEIDLKNMLAITYAPLFDREKTLKLIKEIFKNKDINKTQYFRAIITLGSYFKFKGRIDISANIYSHVLKKIQDLYPELKIITLANLGGILIKQEKITEGISCLNKAVQYQNLTNINKFDILLNDYLAISYATTGKLEKSEEHFKKAIKLSLKKGDDVFYYRNKSNIARLFYIQGKYSSAIIAIKSLLPKIHKSKNYLSEILSLDLISRIYFDLNKFEIAGNYIDQAIFLSSYIKNRQQLFLCLITKMSISFEQLNMEEINRIHQILSNMNDIIDYGFSKLEFKVIDYKAKLLNILLNHSSSDSTSLKQKNIINIFGNVNTDICNYDNMNGKVELSFLYCMLFKHLYDFSKNKNQMLNNIMLKIRKQYKLNLNYTLESYKYLEQETDSQFYIDRLNYTKKFPKI